MRKGSRMVKVSLTIPASLRDQLAQAAVRDDCSEARIIRRALRIYLDEKVATNE